ncbi:MAG TPA: SIS domain-containing protein [Candidatus Limnocylindrales bacterium]|nr:SIS domain-containing protein [Candidatus Limnocylindrales bacterium]
MTNSMTLAELNRRNAHPYHMYDAIRAQPALIHEVLQANTLQLDQAVEFLKRQGSWYFCGIGTSFHAVLVGEYFMRLLVDDFIPTRAIHSFEFVCYPPPVREDTGVLVVSHRGTKNYSLQALEQANRRGATTIVITGKDSAEGIHRAHTVLMTVDQEISAAHTKSYTTALSLLAALIIQLGRHVGKDIEVARAQLTRVPEFIQRALETEAHIQELAQELTEKEFVVFVGGGPNTATAYEVALKMKETNYTPCEGFQAEQFLHGPVAGLSDKMAVWVIAPPGPSYSRCLEIVKVANTIGATTVALVEEEDQNLAKIATHTINLPKMMEALTPLVYIIPLQLFSYYLALTKGANPDIFHFDDPRHQQTKRHYNL